VFTTNWLLSNFFDLHQKSIVPIRLFDKCVGTDKLIGIVGVPLAGLSAGVEKIQSIRMEKAKQGDIEVSLTTDFTIPPCDPLVYSAAMTDTINANLYDTDPMTYEQHMRDREFEIEKKREKEEKTKSTMASFGRGLRRFVY